MPFPARFTPAPVLAFAFIAMICLMRTTAGAEPRAAAPSTSPLAIRPNDVAGDAEFDHIFDIIDKSHALLRAKDGPAAERLVRDAVKLGEAKREADPHNELANFALIAALDELSYVLFCSAEGKNFDPSIEAEERAVALTKSFDDGTQYKALFVRLGAYYQAKSVVISSAAVWDADGAERYAAVVRQEAFCLEHAAWLDDRAAPSPLAEMFARRNVVTTDHIPMIYKGLAMAYAALRKPAEANATLWYAKVLSPDDVDVYASAEYVAAATEDPNGQAMEMMQQVLLGEPQDLVLPRLRKVWPKIIKSSPGATTVPTTGEPPPGAPLATTEKLIDSDPEVRALKMEATRDRMRAKLAAGHVDDARALRNAAVDRWQLPPQVFDPLFDEPKRTPHLPTPLYFKPPPSTQSTERG